MQPNVRIREDQGVVGGVRALRGDTERLEGSSPDIVNHAALTVV